MLGEAARTAEDAARYFELYSRAIRGTSARPTASRSSSRRCIRASRKRSARGCSPSCCRASPSSLRLADAARRRHHHRCRGVRAARADARSFRGAQPRTMRSASPSRPTRSARSRCATGWSLGLRSGASPSGWSKARTGTARSSARSSSACRTTRYSRARPRPICPTSRAPGGCSIAPAALYPAFATHNCRTVATILELAGDRPFEFQKLFGMGDALYEALLAERGVRRAGSTRRSAASPISCLTSCAACSRTAPTPPSSTRSPIPTVPLEALVADPLAGSARAVQPRTAHSAAAQSLSGPAELARPRSRAQRCPRSPRSRRSVPTAAARTSTRSRTPRAQELDFSIARAVAAFESLVAYARVRARRRARARGRALEAAHAASSSRSSCARAGAPMPTRCRKCARRRTSAAITRCRRESIFRSPAFFQGRRASATNCRSTAAACSPASRRGTSRSRSSPARWPRRSPRETR